PASLPDLEVDCRFDLAHQLPAHGLEFKVHTPLERLHIPASDLRAVITPDHAAQDVQRRVGAHQLETPFPVQGPERGGTGSRQRLSPAEKMQDVVALFLYLFHSVGHAAEFKRSNITRLSSPAGVKRGAIQHNS